MISFRALTRSVVAVGSVLALSACVSGSPQPSSEPSPAQPSPAVVEDLSITPPDGWRHGVLGEDFPPAFVASLEPEDDSTRCAQLKVYVRKWFSGSGEKTYDAEDARELSLTSNPELTEIGERQIGGSDAVGAGGVGSCEDAGSEPVPVEYWYVVRPGILWTFTIIGHPSADEVPTELLEALDTVAWSSP